ncbi:MAG TPA: glycoside hydrolase family 2 TIM barrel-domain containing protein, partial [Pseudonocardiaceae bacterium]
MAVVDVRAVGDDEPRRGPTRRKFLIGLGVGVVASTSLGAALLGSTSSAVNTVLGNEWLFGRYVGGCTDPEFDDNELARVTVPHCVADLSWQGWQPADWQSLWVYRQHFDAPADLRRGRAFLTFDGVLSAATVYLNGRRIGAGAGGYLPLTCELTGLLAPGDNVLAVTVDGRWNQDVPPNVARSPQPSAIDFYQPAGIYRPITVQTAPKAYVADVFARPVDVLGPSRSMVVECEVDAAAAVSGPVRLESTLSQYSAVLTGASIVLDGLQRGRNTATMTLTGLADVRLWDVDDPAMCDVRVTLAVDGRQVHDVTVRTGFREAAFTDNGFFLNGRRRKLFGVNRHQWYPFVGGAMPDRVQRRDAEILRNELNCNMVRCSHYPQSPAFLDACDELGLMVWEEVPGWDFVGDAAWRDRVVDNVRSMVTRDRNHPSIIVWGTRINESLGQLTLYGHTDELARQLDPSRPCSGAVAGNRGYYSPLYPRTSGAAVFAFNDYSRPTAPNAPPTLRPPRTGVPYLVSEAVGAVIGYPSYRRTDPVGVQQDQATLHAWVHERAAADDRYCGLLAWCGFDYASGWHRSVNGVKYPGVVDFFRIPKLGAAFYRAQVDPAKRVVIEPAFYWDFSPGSPPTGPGSSVVWSNCDRLKLYLDGRQVASVRPDRVGFPHLAYPPFVVNLSVRAGHRPELRIDGYLNNKLALRRLFSPDTTTDVLGCVADDPTLVADGQDATRIEVRALDRYGAARPHVDGDVTFGVDGPGVLVGDNPLDFGSAGGAAAVW